MKRNLKKRKEIIQMRGEGEEKKRRRSKREKRQWEGRMGVKKEEF